MPNYERIRSERTPALDTKNPAPPTSTFIRHRIKLNPRGGLIIPVSAIGAALKPARRKPNNTKVTLHLSPDKQSAQLAFTFVAIPKELR